MVERLSGLLEEHKTKYRVRELVRAGELYRIDKGIYSDVATPPEVEVILAKHPNAVLTLESAYYYYRLSDELPSRYHLATERNARPIHDTSVAQSFVPLGTLMIGAINEIISGENLRIYDKERLLIETMRYRTKLPYDLYREVVGAFREIRHQLYGSTIDDYLQLFPRRTSIMEAIKKEVF